MALENYGLGSHILLKKQHPCGSYEWEIIRIGADFKIKCCNCGHIIMLPRNKLEKSLSSQMKK